MTHVDTAELYGEGAVEELVGEAIAGRRAEAFLVSKVVPENATRTGTVAACERSLARLRTDWLDAYLLHWPGRHPISRMAGDGRVACNQVLYHLQERAIEHTVIPWCERHGITLVAYSPFGHGSFPGPRTGGGRVLPEVAAAHGATVRQVALRFLVRRSSTVTSPKTGNPGHAAENAGAGDLVLTDADVGRIDTAFPLGPRRRHLPML